MPDRRRAVVFDLDGTLIDSAGDLTDAVNRLLAEESRPPLGLAAVKGMIGDGARRLVERALAASGPEAPDAALDGLTARFLGHYEGHGAVLTRPYPGVPETLAALKAAGRRLGVCTNKPGGPTREILAELGLAPFFDAVMGGDETPARKPDPIHLLAVAAALGAGAASAVLVGDNENDAAAARAAGMPLILVAYGYARVPLAELPAAAVIARFADLPAALERLEAG
jgi:phosphoglycolate phosphatase